MITVIPVTVVAGGGSRILWKKGVFIPQESLGVLGRLPPPPPPDNFENVYCEIRQLDFISFIFNFS